ncbi:MAG: MATE family efflux transporter [bacterium]|nr:MATE family efflux transporter [bacterium]
MKESDASFDRTLVDGPLSTAIWKIVWPTLLVNIFAGLQGLVDHVMVGHFVGYLGNAAIGISWQIFLVVVVFISSLYSGMAILVARFAGADEPEKVSRVVIQAFLASIGLGVVVFAPVGYLLAPRLLDLVHAEPGVQAEALPYLRILFVFGLGMMLFFLMAGALRAAGDARTPMRLGILMTVLNLGFNVVLIRGLGPIPAFGTRGAAMGTVIADSLVAAIVVWQLVTGRLVIRLSLRGAWRPDWKVLGSVVRLGLPTGFQGVVMNIGGVILIRFVGGLEQSAEAQAAYAVGYSQLFSLITWSSGALMAAAITITGQNLGAGHLDRASRSPLACTALGLLIAVPLALLFLLVPRSLMALFGIEDPSVVALGEQLLAFLSLSGLFVTAALSYTGALQGGGDTKSPLYISMFSQLALPLSLCAVLDLVGDLDPAEIWLAIVLGHLSRCLLSIWRFQQGKWKEIQVSIG